MSLRLLGSVALALAALSPVAPAQTTSWATAAGGNWSVAANWTNGAPPLTPTPPTPPTVTVAAQFDAFSTSYTSFLDGNFDLQALRFLNGQTGAVLIRETGSPNPRIITLNPSASGATTLLVQSGSGDHDIGRSVNGNAINTFTQLRLGGAPGTVHTWEVQGGRTLNSYAQITTEAGSGGNSITKTGAGTLVLAGSGAGSPAWSGGLTVAEGRVLANHPSNSTGAGSVTVASGATLGGRGTVFLPGTSRLVVQSGGNLAAGTAVATPALTVAGTSTGGLQMNAGSTYQVSLFGVGPTDISRVDATGSTIINSNKIALDLSVLTTADVAQLKADIGDFNTREYTVLVATGESLQGSGFSTVDVTNYGNFNPGEWVFQFGTFQRFDQDGTGGFESGFASITITPVPEPHYALGLATLPAGYWWTRNRKRASA